MPRGTKDVANRGMKTRFNRETAAEAAKKSVASKKANAPLRAALKGIANQALYGKPPINDDQLRPVAKFYGIAPDEVTFGHLALYKLSAEAAKGDISALNTIAAYAGEKPSERVEISAPDLSALDNAFQAAAGDAG